MIISPPFLPDGDVTQDQSSDDFVESYMQLTGDGKFPVSDYFQWHGGVHLVAPEGNNKTKVPVRAIADGKVLYVRHPTPEPSNKAGTVPHPQNHQGQEGWCDNGCVVIQHDTEIGENLAVTFYSIYMHLKSIEATVTKGSDIHRKSKLGQAGQIYGTDGQIHFEIVADEENTKKFIGDLAFNAPSYHTNQYGCEKAFRAKDGRTDACFGSMYFLVPKFIPLYDAPDASKQLFTYPLVKKQQTIDMTENHSPVLQKDTMDIGHPLNTTPSFGSSGTIDISQYNLPNKMDISKPPPTAFPSAPIPQIVGQNLYVEMVFEKGKCTFITYDEHGKKLGEASQAASKEGSSSYSGQVNEYNLYQASLKLYPSKPTAGFELLRFGRVIGDENFDITQGVSADITHFRQIYTPKGIYWVNLNNKYIMKYSDADFPYWKGWGVVNDDNDGDGRCDSEIIQTLILSAGQKDSSLQTAKKSPLDLKKAWLNHINDSDVKEKLKKIFYKFPTEWSMDKFDERYGWIKKDYFANNDQKFNNFKAHVQSLAFWDEAGIPIDKNHWHFPPIEFIKHFRKCSWLSDGEFKQILPAKIDGKVYIDQSKMIRNSVIKNNVNKVFRKYCVTTPLRITSFLANAFEESAWMTTFSEGTIYRSHPWETKWYPPWNGRGFIQLTHPYNYSGYWEFRGRTISQKFKDFVVTYKYIEKHYHTKVVDPDFAPHKTDNRRFHNAPIQDDHVDATQHINNAVDLKQYQTWRDNIEDQTMIDPMDSAGFYWVLNNISKYADESHSLTINSGTQIYYTSKASNDVASVVNAGSVSKHPETTVNGFIKRCYAYGYALSVLTEKKFPDSDGILLEIPEGYGQRGIHGENLPNSTPKAKSHKKK